MAVKISSFPTQPGPLTGTESVTGLVSGVNKNMLTQSIANLSGASNQVNGAVASVTNSTANVHAYTVAAANLVIGNIYQYNVEFEATNINASPLMGHYTCLFLIGATPFDFGTENTAVVENSNNTVGFIQAQFALSNVSSNKLICRYQIHLFDPSKPNTDTYTNYNFLTETIVVGTNNLTVESQLSSSSVDLKLSIVNSSFIAITQGA